MMDDDKTVKDGPGLVGPMWGLTEMKRKINWKRLILHVPHGIGMVVGLWAVPWLGVPWFVICLLYQLDEDRTIKDEAYHDIRGYMCGMAIGLLLYPFIMALAEWYMSWAGGLV